MVISPYFLETIGLRKTHHLSNIISSTTPRLSITNIDTNFISPTVETGKPEAIHAPGTILPPPPPASQNRSKRIPT